MQRREHRWGSLASVPTAATDDSSHGHRADRVRMFPLSRGRTKASFRFEKNFRDRRTKRGDWSPFVLNGSRKAVPQRDRPSSKRSVAGGTGAKSFLYSAVRTRCRARQVRTWENELGDDAHEQEEKPDDEKAPQDERGWNGTGRRTAQVGIRCRPAFRRSSAAMGSEKLGISSYQSGKFYLLGQNTDGGTPSSMSASSSARPWALPFRIKIRSCLPRCFRSSASRMSSTPADQQSLRCLLRTAGSSPRRELDAHDVGLLRDGRIVFVNTQFNCLARPPSARHSFTPLWKPPFISKIVKEDRCHLNGLAMEDGVPAM